MATNDGGPMFPQSYREPGHSTIVGCSGASLRDWLAGQAPEIPNWFRSQWWRSRGQLKVAMQRPSSMDAGLNMQNPRLREAIRQWFRSYNTRGDMPMYCLSSAAENEEEKALLCQWEEEYTAYAEACEDARIRDEENVFFAWRWYYADAMLAARQAAPPAAGRE